MVLMEKHQSLHQPLAGRFFDANAAKENNRSGSDVASTKHVSDQETLSLTMRVSL